MLKEIDKEVAVAGRLQADRVGWEEKEGERRGGRPTGDGAMLMLFQIFLRLQLLQPHPRLRPFALLLLIHLSPLFLSFATTHSNPIQVTSLAGGLSHNARDPTSTIVFPVVK